jgi:hypothetical protein
MLTDAEIRRIDLDGFCQITCPACNENFQMEPDTDNEPCTTDGCKGKLQSPLRALGLI